MSDDKPDLIILDIMLPDMDGFEVYQKMSRLPSKIPVLFLSARSDDIDVVKGLEIGGEDYMTKPFNHKELIVRIQKILKRIETETTIPEKLIVGEFSICHSQKSVFFHKKKLLLTPTEYKLLFFLAKNTARVTSWETLPENIWGSSHREGGKELVKVNIRRLRKKIEPRSLHSKYVINVRGFGYKLNPRDLSG